VANLTAVREFFKTDRYKERGIGYIDPARADATLDVVQKYQGVDVSFSTDEMFDDSFLPDPMYTFDF
jgi:hypothetical protein